MWRGKALDLWQIVGDLEAVLQGPCSSPHGSTDCWGVMSAIGHMGSRVFAWGGLIEPPKTLGVWYKASPPHGPEHSTTPRHPLIFQSSESWSVLCFWTRIR